MKQVKNVITFIIAFIAMMIHWNVSLENINRLIAYIRNNTVYRVTIDGVVECIFYGSEENAISTFNKYLTNKSYTFAILEMQGFVRPWQFVESRGVEIISR